MKDKIYFDFELPYFKDRVFGLALMKFIHGNKRRLQLSFHTAYRLVDIPGYEDLWGLKKMRHFILWKNY